MSPFSIEKKIIDYSMLLTVVDLNKFEDDSQKDYFLKNYRVFQEKDPERKHLCYVVGIIDYFQLYTFGKSMERFCKRTIKCNCNLETSSQPPDKYAGRFIEYCKGIIVE